MARELFPEHATVEKTGLEEMGYWRMPADHPSRPGWIVLSPIHGQQWTKNMNKKKMVPLAEYGSFLRHPVNGTDMRGVPTNTVDEGWKRLFQQGGAKEFPPSQVFAYMWHEDPPYVGVEFPQIEGMEVRTYYCEECGRVRTVDVMALRSHLEVRHDYRREDFNRYGEDFDIEFSRRGHEKQQDALFGSGVQAAPDLEKPAEDDGRLRCELGDGCDYVVPPDKKNPVQALEMHQRRAKLHKAAAKKQAVPAEVA